jgi:nucleoside-diphosphate-sugar epimerase
VTDGPATIVVTGASGNVGAGVLRALARCVPDAQVIGVCRRPPTEGTIYERVRWHAVDLSAPDAATQLAPAMRGADVVIHLALAVQPVRDEPQLYRANVRGSRAVLEAMTAAGVGQLVYASSLGIYASGASGSVSEEWPDTGQESSTYSRHKVVVERILDQFVLEHPEVTVARFRPTVVVQREAAWLIRSLYLGPFVPRAALGLLRRRVLPVLPLPAGLALQFVHADDVGDAVVRMMQQRASGSFNIAADALDTAAVADLVGAKPVGVSPRAVRRVVAVLSALRLIALTPGWYDVATETPLMDTSKARDQLGWAPTHSSTDCALELLGGLADGATGSSAATGRGTAPTAFATTARRVHDTSLLLWSASALSRALGARRAGAADVAVIGANLAAGTPAALQRMRQGRHDPVALLAPVAVAGAAAASLRSGWSAVTATTILQVLNVLERSRFSQAE